MSALAKEKWAASRIEGRYLQKARKSLYIACEELDYFWSVKEVLEFEMAFKYKKNEGKNQFEIINELAEYFGRDPDEVLILFVDRARKGRL